MTMLRFQPFDIEPGARHELIIDASSGEPLPAGSRVTFVRGRKVYFKAPIVGSRGQSKILLEVPADAVNGLYKAVINTSRKDKLVVPDAIRVMESASHQGVLISDYQKWFYLMDREGIPIKDMGGDLGYVRHPLVATYYAFHFLTGYPQDMDAAQREQRLWTIVRWLEGQCEPGPRGSICVRHRFPLPAYGLAPGWISGLTQGRFAELCARLFKLTGDAHWRELAIGACRIMFVPVSEGGLLATDRFGDKSIEEYVIDPPNWALNGIGSALASLEKVNETVPLEGLDDLLSTVAASLERKMPLFDCADVPGSRVQLALPYSFTFDIPHGFWQRIFGVRPLRVRGMRMCYPSGAEHAVSLPDAFEDSIEAGTARVVGDSVEIHGLSAHCMLTLDGNRDVADERDATQHVLTLDYEAGFSGDMELSVAAGRSRHPVARVAIRRGRHSTTFAFDPNDVLPNGIGRVARYNETYHETNLAWMASISSHGTLPQARHAMRRWLLSYSTGLGRPSLDLSADVTEKLRAEMQELAHTPTKVASLEATLISEILENRHVDGGTRLEGLVPEALLPGRDKVLRIYGIGFRGGEHVRISAREGQCAKISVLRCETISRDEIRVHIAELNAEQPVALELRLGRDTEDLGCLAAEIVLPRAAGARDPARSESA